MQRRTSSCQASLAIQSLPESRGGDCKAQALPVLRRLQRHWPAPVIDACSHFPTALLSELHSQGLIASYQRTAVRASCSCQRRPLPARSADCSQAACCSSEGGTTWKSECSAARVCQVSLLISSLPGGEIEGLSAVSPPLLAASRAGARPLRMQPVSQLLSFLSSMPKTFSRPINLQRYELRVLVKDAQWQRGQLIIFKPSVAQVWEERRGSQNAAPHEFAN